MPFLRYRPPLFCLISPEAGLPGKEASKPSFPLAEERVVERSKDRVSKYGSGMGANKWQTILLTRHRYP